MLSLVLCVASLMTSVGWADPSPEYACNRGDGGACVALGYRSHTAEPADLAGAISGYERGCDLDNSNGCYNLGVMVRDGEGLDADLRGAAYLFDKACTLGDPDACYNLAIQMSKGQGVRTDLPRAEELFAIACEKGLKSACSQSADAS